MSHSAGLSVPPPRTPPLRSTSANAPLQLAARLIFAVLLGAVLLYTGSMAGSVLNAGLSKRQPFGSTGGNFQPARTAGDRDDEVVEALAVEDIEDEDGVGGGEDVYRLYTGSGSTDDGWPEVDDWVSFEDMYAFSPFRSLFFFFGVCIVGNGADAGEQVGE